MQDAREELQVAQLAAGDSMNGKAASEVKGSKDGEEPQAATNGSVVRQKLRIAALLTVRIQMWPIAK